MPATVWFGGGNTIKDSIKYKYDNCGNIEEIRENGHLTARYKYDSLNRLIREDNKVLNKTSLYTYDNNGNITERCEYAYTSKTGEELSELECTHYSYDYDGDKLVSYNGEVCEYAENGRVTKYRGKALEWQYERRLIGYDNFTFVYDGSGKRIQKLNKATIIHYLTRETVVEPLNMYDNAGNLVREASGTEYIYDSNGVTGMIYDGEKYFYRKDVQGNIIALLDSAGNVVVKYVYDAWGNHAVLDADGNDIDDATHIGNVNPFRYRGYYYDTETGLYFLQTRYYDPETGRFISQDGIEYADPETINGLNLYAYCGNNPVNYLDYTGCSRLSADFVISLISSLMEIGIGAGLSLAGWAIKTGAKPNNIGIGVFNKYKASQISHLSKASNYLSKVSTAVAIISVAVTVVGGVQNDIARGYTTDRIVSNAVTNTIVYGGLTFGIGAIGAKIGSILGSFIPGLGNVVGAAIGFVLGTVVGLLLDLQVNGKSIIDHIRDGIYSFWKWLFG